MTLFFVNQVIKFVFIARTICALAGRKASFFIKKGEDFRLPPCKLLILSNLQTVIFKRMPMHFSRFQLIRQSYLHRTRR